MQMNKGPLISVIVPCYRVETYLPNCIESILNQTYSHWELVLVDDGSPDKSGNICDDYARKDSRIKVLHKENGGLSSARNAGMKLMQGDYVTFLDSDDFLHKDALSTMMSYIEAYDAQIVQCNFIRGYDTNFPTWNGKERINKYDNHTIFTKLAAKIIVCGKLYRRDILNGETMPEGIINEDDWTTWKLYYKAKTIVVTSRPLYYYTINQNSIMSVAKKKPDTTYFGAYKERIAFFKQLGEKDLEDMSRLQFCKSLVLLYANEQLAKSQRIDIKELFSENWKILKTSRVIPTVYKILFATFHICPYMVSKVLS